MSVTVKTYAAIDEAAQALGGGRDTAFLGGGTLVMRALNEGTADFPPLVRTTDAAFRTISPASSLR